MLDLRMPQEANGGLISLSPEIGLSQVQRIIEANDRVQLLGQNLEVSLRLRNGSRRAPSLAGGEGGSSGCKRGKYGSLHDDRNSSSRYCEYLCQP